jgi:putative tricarboxylic transport membrane protein
LETDHRGGYAVNRDELAGGVLIFLFGAVTSYVSLKMPIGTFRAAGSGLFPLCLGLLLMALSGALVFRVLLQREKEKKERTVKIPNLPRQVILFLGTMVLATLLFSKLGYPLMSFLMLLALMRILGMKRWAWNVLLSFMVTGVSYILFVYWLKIPLPKGWIGL